MLQKPPNPATYAPLSTDLEAACGEKGKCGRGNRLAPPCQWPRSTTRQPLAPASQGPPLTTRAAWLGHSRTLRGKPQLGRPAQGQLPQPQRVPAARLLQWLGQMLAVLTWSPRWPAARLPRRGPEEEGAELGPAAASGELNADSSHLRTRGREQAGVRSRQEGTNREGGRQPLGQLGDLLNWTKCAPGTSLRQQPFVKSQCPPGGLYPSPSYNSGPSQAGREAGRMGSPGLHWRTRPPTRPSPPGAWQPGEGLEQPGLANSSDTMFTSGQLPPWARFRLIRRARGVSIGSPKPLRLEL
jgi:hypothetical protein